MKKTLLFIVFALVSFFAQAQDYSCDSLLMDIAGSDEHPQIYFNKSFSLEMRDRSMLTCLPLNARFGYQIANYGDRFYKIDPQNLTVMDSAFIETDYNFDEDNQNLLLAKAPDDDGYILAKLLQSKNGQTWLRINRIDEALNIQAHQDALMVLLEDFVVYGLSGIKLEDDCIVLMYTINESTPVVARVRLDGTISEKVTYENLFQLEYVTHGFAKFSDTPREYAIYDWNVCEGDTCLVYHVLDSLLTLQETIVMASHEGDIFPVQPGMTPITDTFDPVGVLPWDDNTFIEAIQYERHNITRNGACLLKYDKTTLECLANAQFESWPIYLSPEKMGYPIGMVRSEDGNLYFAYRTNNNVMGGSASTKGWIGIAKLDGDLNIIWQRYCLGSDVSTSGYKHAYCYVSLMKEGFMVGGKIFSSPKDKLFYVFVHDGDINSIPETGFLIRPYTYWPNPVESELRLQYSPDVTPTQIELYDLQGRMVRTQRNGLESINMEGLPAGTYTMRVVLENGKAYSDKVVKE